MNVADFVAQTLVQIAEGVEQAQAARANKLGVINPVFGQSADDIDAQHQQLVEFDIAVSASDKVDASGKAGVAVLGFELGGGAGKTVEQGTVSRVKFSVPIVPPAIVVKRAVPSGRGFAAPV